MDFNSWGFSRAVRLFARHLNAIRSKQSSLGRHRLSVIMTHHNDRLLDFSDSFVLSNGTISIDISRGLI